MKRGIAMSGMVILLLGATVFAAQEPSPGSRGLEAPLRIGPLTTGPNGATVPQRRDSPRERRDFRDRPEGREYREHDEHHPGAHEHVRIFVVPGWDPIWGYGPSAPPLPAPVYGVYCLDPPGFYPAVPQCPGGWMTVVPPTGPAGG